VSGPFDIFSLQGRTAFVTGASAGLGLHIAGLLAAAGASVGLAARRLDAVEKAAEALIQQGLSAAAARVDLTNVETIAPAIESVETAFGRPIDILVNNAGVIHFAKFLDHDDEAVGRIIDTNFKGTFAVAREGARRMAAAGGGSIINVASSSGLRTPGFLAAYASSKAALIHLSEVMALELASKNIRVNVICPGNFVTDMHQIFADRSVDEGIVKRIPQKRFGQAPDLDGPMLLLASDAGRYMTGATLKVDGGQTLSWL
jgi:NAD(P)-dependent dehydrogenase (short-subunit alcohol dehydrogenase family)